MVIIQCDEHMRRAVWMSLRSKGLDVRTMEEENLKGMDDNELLQFCLERNRILLTNDRDFLTLTKQNMHAGILFLTSQQAPVAEITSKILYLCYALDYAQFQNSVFYVP